MQPTSPPQRRVNLGDVAAGKHHDRGTPIVAIDRGKQDSSATSVRACGCGPAVAVALKANTHMKRSRKVYRFAGIRRMCVISEGTPNRFGGPQYPVPRLT